MAYAIQSDWGAGFVVNITITNLGSPITAWTLGYSYGGNQSLASGWNGNWSQSGSAVQVQTGPEALVSSMRCAASLATSADAPSELSCSQV